MDDSQEVLLITRLFPVLPPDRVWERLELHPEGSPHLFLHSCFLCQAKSVSLRTEYHWEGPSAASPSAGISQGDLPESLRRGAAVLCLRSVGALTLFFSSLDMMNTAASRQT